MGNDHIQHPDHPSFEDEEILLELQSIWDDQIQPLEKLVERPEAQPQSLDFSHCRTWRRHLMAEYAVLAIINILMAMLILFAFVLGNFVFVRIAGYVLGCTNVLMASLCIFLFLYARWCHPARVGTFAMSRHIRYAQMEAHYAQRSEGAHPHKNFSLLVNSASAAFSSSRQIATISIASMFIFAFVSLSPKGDGYAMTKVSPNERAAVITGISEMLDPSFSMSSL